jgi:hypothetical protein
MAHNVTSSGLSNKFFTFRVNKYDFFPTDLDYLRKNTLA